MGKRDQSSKLQTLKTPIIKKIITDCFWHVSKQSKLQRTQKGKNKSLSKVGARKTLALLNIITQTANPSKLKNLLELL